MVQKILLLSIFSIVLASCKKKEVPPPVSNDPAFVSPLIESNGWDVGGAKSLNSMDIYDANEVVFNLKYVKKHGDVLDVYFNALYPIISTEFSRRWQTNAVSKKEVYYKAILGVYEEYRPNLFFRSNSLAEEDYEYIRKDGHYKGFANIDGFATGNYNTNVTNYPVVKGDLGEFPFMSNGVIKFLDQQKMVRPYGFLWSTTELGTIRHGNDVYIVTIESTTDNYVRVYKSTSTPSYQGNGNDIYDEYSIDLFVEAPNIAFPSTVNYQGISYSFMYRDGDEYYFTLIVKENSTDNSTNNYTLTRLSFNVQTGQLSSIPSSYPDYNEYDGTLIQLGDRPGAFVKECYTGQFGQEKKLFYFDGQQRTEIELPTGSFSYCGRMYYNEGKIYALVTNGKNIYVISKDI